MKANNRKQSYCSSSERSVLFKPDLSNRAKDGYQGLFGWSEPNMKFKSFLDAHSQTWTSSSVLLVRARPSYDGQGQELRFISFARAKYEYQSPIPLFKPRLSIRASTKIRVNSVIQARLGYHIQHQDRVIFH